MVEKPENVQKVDELGLVGGNHSDKGAAAVLQPRTIRRGGHRRRKGRWPVVVAGHLAQLILHGNGDIHYHLI